MADPLERVIAEALFIETSFFARAEHAGTAAHVVLEALKRHNLNAAQHGVRELVSSSRERAARAELARAALEVVVTRELPDRADDLFAKAKAIRDAANLRAVNGDDAPKRGRPRGPGVA